MPNLVGHGVLEPERQAVAERATGHIVPDNTRCPCFRPPMAISEGSRASGWVAERRPGSLKPVSGTWLMG